MTPHKWLTHNLAKRHLSKFLLPGLLFGSIILVLIINWSRWQVIFHPLENVVFSLEDKYEQWFDLQILNHPFFLLPLAFGGGLIASLSPCILGLLPVNLSYIGTRQIKSRWDAFIKAGLFVLGVVTMLSLLGLFASLATAIMVGYRGYINIAVGVLIILMGLCFLGIVRLPLPQTNLRLPITGSYGVGLTFALVSSPCSSPLLYSFVAAAAATNSQIYSTLTMVSYALGYTAVIFFASLFTGLAKQTRLLLKYSEQIVRFGCVALILFGGYYLVNGISWVVLELRIEN
ncbi:MAG: cytochrome c biogenesis protein CcdA [Symploca sp. SIO2C1]|nr:cytochrome c biogenesis protein CcdA [Symploca sp. SIO2C1]